MHCREKKGGGRTFIFAHIYLLLACAIPVWIWGVLQCYIPTERDGIDKQWSGSGSERMVVLRLIPFIGCIAVGLGDSMVYRFVCILGYVYA